MKKEQETRRIYLEVSQVKTEAEIKNQKLHIQNEKMTKYFLYTGILFLFAIVALIFNAFRNKRKDNALITKQKNEAELQKEVVEAAHEELEEKNQEIMDSIKYAKRIQSAILPPVKIVKEHLKDSFILYKPKDIVAGDFYWMESVAPISNKKEPLILFAAADCTGHGVPGCSR